MADTSESAARPDDLLAFLKGYHPDKKGKAEKDVIAGRYKLVTSQPITEVSSSYVKGFTVRDEKAPDLPLFALVFEGRAPLRQKNISALKTFRHPALASILADGPVETGTPPETHYAVVMEKPTGQPLSQLLSRHAGGMPESLLIQQYLRPLSEILSGFTKLGISHNRINPGNIFVSGNQIMLGECISEPSGFSQDYLFEPVERILTSPRAKADFAPSADVYALAILALHLVLGMPPSPLPKEQLVERLLSMGAYHTLALPWDLPSGLQDFFRGAMGDGRRERWDPATLESWLAGKRFNLIVPRAPRETARGFDFAGGIYFNGKNIAHALWQHWKEARLLANDNRLVRWLNVHAHKNESGDAIARLIQSASPMTPAQEEETLSRIITLLDPQGPLRFRQVSVAPESFGALLSHALVAERHEDTRTLLQMLEADLTGFWIEQQKGTSEYTALAARFQKARKHLRMKGLGFGMERALYDLNPSLPCLSPLLKGQPAYTLAEMLAGLDASAPRNVASEEVGDAHVAAFIASRLDISREIRLTELHAFPKLEAYPTLVMLKLLRQAQRKTGELTLKGLAHWLAVRLLPLFGDMYSQARQRKLQDRLRAAAAEGSINGVAELFLKPDAFESDRREFKNAAAEYASRRRQIAALKSTSGLQHYAGMQGRGVAQSIAFSVCLATVYMSLRAYFHL